MDSNFTGGNCLHDSHHASFLTGLNQEAKVACSLCGQVGCGGKTQSQTKSGRRLGCLNDRLSKSGKFTLMLFAGYYHFDRIVCQFFRHDAYHFLKSLHKMCK